MANAFDDLLGNLVKRLRGVGVGSGTAAENRAKIDYMTASNRAAQAGQATPSEYPYYYGSGADPATAYSNNVGTLNRQAPTGMGGYNQGGMFKFAEQQSVNDTIAGAVPESLSPWRENQLRIEERIRQEEEAARPKNRGLGTSTEEAGYEANLEKARRERAKLLEGNISLDRQENEERRMLSQAETEQARRGLFDYGGMDMPYQGQGESTIELDPSIVTVGDNPTDEQIVKTLEEDYANLAASGADSATLSELAREIDSYRDKKVSLPSIVSEAAASDVVESSRAEVVDTSDRFTTYIERVEGFKTGEGKTPFRYTSPEGGLDTIGLGHKLTQKEVDSNSVYGFDLDTLTKEQAKEIFKKDLPKYEKMLKSDLKTNYKKYKMKQPINYDTLNRKQQEMFLDFTFNLGSLRSFPKFTEAVLKGDMATARKEYKRTFTNDKGVTKEVKDRNEQFYNTYLK
jgi:GH24 family phage-related lysozyme (muramidase)